MKGQFHSTSSGCAAIALTDFKLQSYNLLLLVSSLFSMCYLALALLAKFLSYLLRFGCAATVKGILQTYIKEKGWLYCKANTIQMHYKE